MLSSDRWQSLEGRSRHLLNGAGNVYVSKYAAVHSRETCYGTGAVRNDEIRVSADSVKKHVRAPTLPNTVHSCARATLLPTTTTVLVSALDALLFLAIVLLLRPRGICVSISVY